MLVVIIAFLYSFLYISSFFHYIVGMKNLTQKRGWFGASGTHIRVNKQYVIVEYVCWTSYL